MNLFSKNKILPAFRVQHVEHKEGAAILNIDGLTVNYEGRKALEDLSFRLDVGERIAVIGPNGAGKSTLFKTVAGVIPASRGVVKIFGYGPGGHICIAYVPQRSQVDWAFPASVADVVMMGGVGKIGLFRWPKAVDWDYVYQCLELVGLENFAKRQINELSGGQQQRMFIARALAQEAELMLMDEPFSGLDIKARDEILQILDILQERKVTVMVALHDLNLATTYFNRVLLINRRLIGIGSAEEVLTNDHLMEAYGGHLHVLHTDDGIVFLQDTCCDHGQKPGLR